MLLGGISPTSVTTAVMDDGGVKSYNGFRMSRFNVEGRMGERFGGVEKRAGADTPEYNT